MKRVLCILSALAITGMSAVDAMAGDRNHDDGIMVRVSGGINNGSGQIDDDTSGTKKLSGWGLDFEAAAGKFVAPNLAVHATTFGFRLKDPGIGYVGPEGKGNYDIGVIAAGTTFYIMPANMFFSLSVGGAKAEIDVDNLQSKSGWGIGMEFVAGKEWFITEQIGIGAALGVIFYSIPDGNIDGRWNGFHAPVRFSMTFNS